MRSRPSIGRASSWIGEREAGRAAERDRIEIEAWKEDRRAGGHRQRAELQKLPDQLGEDGVERALRQQREEVGPTVHVGQAAPEHRGLGAAFEES